MLTRGNSGSGFAQLFQPSFVFGKHSKQNLALRFILRFRKQTPVAPDVLSNDEGFQVGRNRFRPPRRANTRPIAQELGCAPPRAPIARVWGSRSHGRLYLTLTCWEAPVAEVVEEGSTFFQV